MNCWVRTCCLVFVSWALVACGQKGPLVLPDAPKRQHTIPTLTAPAKPRAGANTPAPADSSPAIAPATPAGGPSTPASPPTPPTTAPDSTTPQP